MKEKNIHTNEFLDQRVIFKDENTRKQFFLQLKDEFGTWTQLRKKFNIPKSRLEHFRDGSISLPNKQFQKLCFHLTQNDKEIYEDKIILKDKNWGRSKGGKTTYAKYKEMFEKGRAIASQKRISRMPRHIDISPELCEFIGAFIGDGFMNKYASTYLIQITGDYQLDKQYYKNTLNSIIKQVSPKSKPYMVKVDNTLRFTVYSKDMYLLFTERLHMERGKKVYTVTIPDEIINSNNQKLINSCVRGIFDTDGCVAFDKRKIYAKPYIRIILNMKSLKLIRQVRAILQHQGINATITKDGEVIQINGITECKKFIKIIGFSNPRHLNKIKHI
jgi:hypothetical protein